VYLSDVMIVSGAEFRGKSGCGRFGGKLECWTGESEKVGKRVAGFEFWSERSRKVSVGTGINPKVVKAGFARLDTIVLRSVAEMVKLRSGV